MTPPGLKEWSANDDDEDDDDCECESDEDESLDDDDSATSSAEASTSTEGSDKSREANEILNEDQGVPQEGVHPDDVSEQVSVQAEDQSERTEPEPPEEAQELEQLDNPFVPNMQGQTHEQQNLILAEEEAKVCDTGMARHAVNLLTALKQRTTKTKSKHPAKADCFLINCSPQKGLKKFGKKGFDSALNEMKQLHDRDCWKPIKLTDLSQSEKKKALESLMFLVEKKSGKIKARHCANGSEQREWINSDDAASPTVATNSVMLTATIEAEEHRDVATFDVPNAFITNPCRRERTNMEIESL